ncbi:DUF2092 domain-containing protein [Caulobacter sp. 17J65-9]|uniref:DUF2092 domain-containing protein n=1 Tax=Caulobacter sp. 17J65-9 TaxID=2709382 RepID=UPI0013CBFEF7|nr:DUF2092 domain-containing protein [Caulobacter sp. 17J65-9]NEX93013.1 DUF2092 domain-containing protein [Caulobacter sp. 17J65-9]
MARPNSSTALALAALVTLSAGAAGAQTRPAPKPPAAASAQTAPAKIDPKAMAVLKASCAALKNAKTLSFTAVDTYERAARNGQPLYYTVKSDVTLERPNKLKVVKVGDGVPDEFYYDGKTVTAYVPSQEVAAVADAPPNIDDMLDAAWSYAAIHYPFADVIVSDPCAIFDESLKSAFYVGQSNVVGGVPTDVIALTTDRVQGQIWVGAQDRLPRMIRTNYPSEPGAAGYQTEYSNWRVNAPVAAGTFTSPKAQAARKIAFLPPSVGDPRANAPAKQGGRP